MRQIRPILAAIAVLSLALLGCSSGGDDAGGGDPAAGAADGPNPLRDAYFGDLHVHTRFSFDAYLFQTRTNPDDAYRFAKGEAIVHPSGHELQLQSGALDFQAVTDHGMYLGVMPEMDNPESVLYDTSLGADLRGGGGFARAIQGLRSGEFAELPAGRRGPRRPHSVAGDHRRCGSPQRSGQLHDLRRLRIHDVVG